MKFHGFSCDAGMAGWASLSRDEAEIMLSLPIATSSFR
jgi:hypothetical protein